MPEQLVQKVEEAWGLQFAPGHNDSLSFMAHLWEPVRCHFRPLVSFSSTGGLRGHGGSVSVLVGARRHRVRGAHAW